MIKHSIGTAVVMVALVLMYHVYSIDTEVHSLKRASDIIEKSKTVAQVENQTVMTQSVVKSTPQKSSQSSEADEKLKALTQKAGNLSLFEVSKLYKSKCSSCHGINGEGGVGHKIIGLSYERLMQSLKDFKSGAQKNYVMYGLLQNLTNEELETLAKEISLFEAKLKKAK